MCEFSSVNDRDDLDDRDKRKFWDDRDDWDDRDGQDDRDDWDAAFCVTYLKKSVLSTYFFSE